MEQWKDIPGWEGKFQASTEGRIRSLRVLNGTLATDSGYPTVTLRQGERAYVHSLVAETFVGPRPFGMQVNHKDRVRTNNRPENLEYLTSRDNNRHSILSRAARRFSQEQIDQIADWYYNEGCSQREIVRRLNNGTHDNSLANAVHSTIGKWISPLRGQKRNPFQYKLTVEDGKRIRELREQGMSLEAISKIYKCHSSHISRVSRGLLRTGAPKKKQAIYFGKWFATPKGGDEEE